MFYFCCCGKKSFELKRINMTLTEGLVNIAHLISVDEAAVRKEVTKSTIYKWIESGKINGFEVDTTKIVIDDETFSEAKKTPRGKGERKKPKKGEDKESKA